MSILGHSVQRVEDPRLLTVGGRYVADIPLEGVLHVVFVRSTMAHAELRGVDVDAARAMPGVVDVVTATDLAGPDGTPRVLDVMPMFPSVMGHPLLATDRVRFVGEPIAAVLAETQSQAVDAAELVEIDYEPLPVVVDPTAAETSEALLFPEHGSNLVYRFPAPNQIDLSGCEVVVRATIRNSRVAACPIEPRVSACFVADDGRLTWYTSCQGAHPARTAYAGALGIEPERIRVIVPDVGGGFGAKAGPYPEDMVLGLLTQRVGRPVRWAETRSENMVGLGHGRGQVQTIELGGTRAGELTHYRLSALAEAGAYPAIGAVLPFMTGLMATGVYAIPNLAFEMAAVVTNTTPTAAYRGAGRPEAAAAIERAVDLFAAEIGMDPAEIRRRNYLRPDAFPLTTPGGANYDSGDYERSLDLALEHAGYGDLRAEQAGRREAGDVKQLGVGIATYVEITSPVAPFSEFGAAELRPDGSLLVRSGSTPYGQGHATTFAMIASEQTGIPMERIEVLTGDTDLIPSGQMTGGSRSVQIAGSAVHEAADELVAKARAAAADLLEASPGDVVLDKGSGSFHVAGTPARSVSWAEVAGASAADPLEGVATSAQAGPSFPFGTHVAVVEVDTETGRVELVRIVAVDDAGVIVNPLLAGGQVHGGLAQGAAQALMEEVRYDVDGNPLTANFADYPVISAAELPHFEVHEMQTPSPNNPLGAKGIGESGTIGSTPAVQNAVCDALSAYGIRHLDMPASPEKVWRALQG